MTRKKNLKKKLDSNLILNAKDYSNDILRKQNLIHLNNFSKFKISLVPKTLSHSIVNELNQNILFFNKLYDQISFDINFLKEALNELVKEDEFTKNLFNIFVKTCDLEYNKQYSFWINRSDYMIEKTGDLKQVEFNTISCCFQGISSKVFNLHKKLHTKNLNKKENLRFVENKPDYLTVKGLFMASKIWEKNECKNNSLIVMVVKDNEVNSVDQDILINLIQKNYGKTMIKMTFDDINTKCKFNNSNNHIEFENNSVSIIYYRTGYSPEHYRSETDWKTRLKIEKSHCIKCPSIGAQLSGTKKVQQILCTKSLKNYLSPQEEKKIKKFFVEMHSLQELDKLKEAKKNPFDWFLKPQREGGGFVLNGKKILEAFNNKRPLKDYILMKKIDSETKETLFWRKGEVSFSESVTEIGTFGVYLRYKKETVLNYPAGYLLRTKPITSIESGVTKGDGVIDGFIVSN